MFSAFERFNVDDLYFASISTSSYNGSLSSNQGMSYIGSNDYGYLTIVLKKGNEYIDLNNPSYKVVDKEQRRNGNYIIIYKEPFSKYYIKCQNQNRTISKRKVVLEAHNYYQEFNNDYVDYKLQEDQKIRQVRR